MFDSPANSHEIYNLSKNHDLGYSIVGFAFF